MDINKLRDELVKAVKEKYPKDLTPENRYINLTDQVAGFGKSLQLWLIFLCSVIF
ncbi:MAG: hypothetical protein AAB535_03750 [Patescibacteria group bacterium]